MLTDIVLDFDTQPEVLNLESLFNYRGPKDLSSVKSLQAIADTSEGSLSYLSDLLPNLEKLRLNGSNISSIRDIGCSLKSLRLLSLANCHLPSLNGVATISKNLEELYVAFNDIDDVSFLIGMDKLKVLDLEGSQITDLGNLRFLTCCTDLRSLTLVGNPCIKNLESYVHTIAELVPNLVYLDECRIRGRRKVVVQSPENSVPVAPPSQSLTGPRARRRSAETAKQCDDGPITEMITDKADARPPSARGESIMKRVRLTVSNSF
jgi:hypothetical protein